MSFKQISSILQYVLQYVNVILHETYSFGTKNFKNPEIFHLQWVFEIQTSVDFRHSISVQFPNNSDFRNCLKSKTKVRISDAYFSKCVWQPSYRFWISDTFVKCLHPKFCFQKHKGVWNLNSQEFRFQTLTVYLLLMIR